MILNRVTMDYENMNSVDRSRATQLSFLLRVLLVQVMGGGAVVLCVIWILHFRDGFAWQVLFAMLHVHIFCCTHKLTAVPGFSSHPALFGLQSDPAKQFNYHPFCMLIGLIFLYGDGEMPPSIF